MRPWTLDCADCESPAELIVNSERLVEVTVSEYIISTDMVIFQLISSSLKLSGFKMVVAFSSIKLNSVIST